MSNTPDLPTTSNASESIPDDVWSADANMSHPSISVYKLEMGRESSPPSEEEQDPEPEPPTALAPANPSPTSSSTSPIQPTPSPQALSILSSLPLTAANNPTLTWLFNNLPPNTQIYYQQTTPTTSTLVITLQTSTGEFLQEATFSVADDGDIHIDGPGFGPGRDPCSQHRNAIAFVDSLEVAHVSALLDAVWRCG